MRGSGDFRAALEAGDHKALRRMSEVAEPHLSRLTEAQAEIVMHQARTQARSIALGKRAWSHRWLVERGHLSLLPDRLKTRAEQICPRVVRTVGIALKASTTLAPVAHLIRKGMEDAVLEAAADGRLDDTAFVHARIEEARQRTKRQLLGIGD